MKTNVLKTASLIAGLLVLSACSGAKNNDNRGGVVATVGPQGRISAFGSSNTYCELSNGQIVCSSIDQATGAVCNTPARSYNNQDIVSLCNEVRSIHNQALQPNSCNVSAATSRILQEYCGGNNGGLNPVNPGFPGGPGLPPVTPARFLNCNVSVNGSYPTPVSLLAGNGPSSFTLFLSETKSKSILKIFNVWYPSSVGEVKLSYIPAKGRIPETLTVTGKIKDRAADRRVNLKHSGYANARLSMSANVNGIGLNVDCNQNMTANYTLSETANLVCVGNSHMVGSDYDENIQFIRPLNSIVSGEEVHINEAVSLNLDKRSGLLTMNTRVDNYLETNMSSTSSLKADALAEANEGLGKAKITCSVK